ncbi:glycosyltransferase family 32 protein [Pedobacter steynii]|uniref:Glycosyltransferase sugar-binding region containing DXD motif-containing protein n=1 Tax=Pedobacter steynii TaxID=430522 RepID=A0A1D7QNE6_9SPHI|nr:glycosyltransferase [Pedobacter steynii]AOM80175.1 hypothetical protein BFS30_25240 [Pedobacter steynii]
MNAIPKKIHLIYKTHHIPKEYENFLESIQLHHPEWEITVYDDAEARAIVLNHMPDLLEIYDQYSLNVQRTDLFRIIVVYLFGGFYLDLDMLCFKSLNPLCQHKLVLGEEKKLTPEECLKLGLTHPVRIANYMFGSIPRHAFWLELIHGIREYSRIEIRNEDDVLNSTGPGLLTNVYHDLKETYQDITLIPNHHKLCMRSCSANSCHFGDYAAHFHLGKWRWESGPAPASTLKANQ